jgi:hypothetical protein
VSRKHRRCPSTCDRKTAYETREAAEKQAAMLRDVSMRRARVYRCGVCRRWFVSEERFGPKGKRG